MQFTEGLKEKLVTFKNLIVRFLMLTPN